MILLMMMMWYLMKIIRSTIDLFSNVHIIVYVLWIMGNIWVTFFIEDFLRIWPRLGGNLGGANYNIQYYKEVMVKIKKKRKTRLLYFLYELQLCIHTLSTINTTCKLMFLLKTVHDKRDTLYVCFHECHACLSFICVYMCQSTVYVSCHKLWIMFLVSMNTDLKR